MRKEITVKRFVWRLQRVLDIRRIEEKTKEAELIRLTEALAERQGELIVLRRSLAELAAEIRMKTGRERLSEQEHFLRWSAGVDERVKRLDKEIQELTATQKEKITEMVKVRRFREGLEKLREKAQQQFMKEQGRLEQKELDEAGMGGFVRNRSGEGSRKNEAEQELGVQYQETEKWARNS